jgi:hypothetical protein
MWQGTWRIMKHELRLAWRGYVFTLLFLAYFTIFSTLFLYGHLTGELSSRVSWNLDFAHLAFVPLMGFLFDPAMFRYRREDTYSRKLAEWQTMPIGVGQIIAARMLLQLLVLFTDCVLYFGVQYAVIPELRGMLGPAGFVLNLLSWLGYGIAVGALMIYLELGFSGRRYFNLCFVIVACFLLAALLLGVSGASAVLFFLEAAADRNWMAAAAMLAAAAAAAGGFGALLHHRINRRSFWT